MVPVSVLLICAGSACTARGCVKDENAEKEPDPGAPVGWNSRVGAALVLVGVGVLTVGAGMFACLRHAAM